MSRNNEIQDAVRRSLERYFKDMDGEKPMIELVLGQAEGNQSLAATMLGINRNTLRKKMQQLRIKG
jgi:Fis family transcriptional regulator